MKESKTDFVAVCNIIDRDSTNLFWVKKMSQISSFVKHLNRKVAFHFYLFRKNGMCQFPFQINASEG